MKKTNKGFSMVELIIVIAIMAILAGALAPALIKYINKSRVSTDIQTANTIATACQTALANESGYDAADTATYSGVNFCLDVTKTWAANGTDSFMDTISQTVGGTNPPKVKSKKCIAKKPEKTGGTGAAASFVINVDPVANKVTVMCGGKTKNHVLYPTASECLTNESLAQCEIQ